MVADDKGLLAMDESNPTCDKRFVNGTAANVVFPTGTDRRDDVGSPDRFDIYYGMADNKIGVARLDVPELLPLEELQTRRKQRCNVPDSRNSEQEKSS